MNRKPKTKSTNQPASKKNPDAKSPHPEGKSAGAGGSKNGRKSPLSAPGAGQARALREAKELAEGADKLLVKAPAAQPSEAADPADHGAHHGHGKKDLRYTALLTLGALGVVYGDIGTSPLYALRECFFQGHAHALPLERESLLGILSLIFWSLTIVISIKYLSYVMRANNRGEGGVLALMALAQPSHDRTRKKFIIVVMGLFGAALLYGDGMITPAISVLSAIEGIEILTPALKDWIVPITIAILFMLFLPQKHGAGRLGSLFGPIITVWFLAIGALGAASLARHPDILAALHPVHAWRMFHEHPSAAFHSLGSVFLVVTGGEALYADMGHFGRGPIQIGWFGLALPALLLNYFGQGALLLHQPETVVNPFFHMAPKTLLGPLVALSTAATVIASQAVISGAFSLTRQAVQLGYLPRLEITHTSGKEIGQIYVPYVNWGLLLAAVGLVLGFRSSGALAGAYGVAVTTTMGITTILVFFVAREKWGWSLFWLLPLSVIFLVIDLAFFGANILKVAEGGWFPLGVGVAALILMTTWRRGRELLGERMRERLIPLPEFLVNLREKTPIRAPGAAIFMTGSVDFAPPALVHNLRHNRVLHETVVIMRVITEEIPHVSDAARLRVENLGDGIYSVAARYGFMDSPNAPEALHHPAAQKIPFNFDEATYFLGRETLIPTKRPGMALWREQLFGFVARNAQSATAFFKIPADQVVEIGIQVEL